LAIAMTSIATSFRSIHLHSLSLFLTIARKSMSDAGGVLIEVR
jgi:hypothetical protein